MDEMINYDHHAFEPNIHDGMCEHCNFSWNDKKHYNWKGEQIPMKNASIIIVKEDGTSEKRSSNDFEEGEL